MVSHVCIGVGQLQRLFGRERRVRTFGERRRLTPRLPPRQEWPAFAKFSTATPCKLSCTAAHWQIKAQWSNDPTLCAAASNIARSVGRFWTDGRSTCPHCVSAIQREQLTDVFAIHLNILWFSCQSTLKCRSIFGESTDREKSTSILDKPDGDFPSKRTVDRSGPFSTILPLDNRTAFPVPS